MPTSHSDSERFSLLVDALRPWLGKVVFIGGWAHRLYRERPEAGAPSYDALRTEDADIALAPGTIARTADLRGRLIARGFFEEMSGEALDHLNELWHVSVAPQLRPSLKREVAARVTGLFHTTTDSVRSASLIAAHRGLTPASIQELCRLGLTRLFR